MKMLVVAMLIGMTTPAFAADAPMPAYAGVPADLERAAIAFDRAQVGGDGAVLRALLADDYLLINSRDQRENKAQFIADYTAPGSTVNPFIIDDQVIKVWADGAILGGVVTMTGSSEGKTYSVRLRFSDVWAKRGGKWQVIFTQANRVTTP